VQNYGFELCNEEYSELQIKILFHSCVYLWEIVKPVRTRRRRAHCWRQHPRGVAHCSTCFPYACNEGISYATSSDGVILGVRSVAIPPSAGISRDPIPVSPETTSHVMAFKTRPMGAQDPRADTSYLATSTNCTSWPRPVKPGGGGSAPGLVRDRSGLYRVYMVHFPPR
jgi:hypothetical protein